MFGRYIYIYIIRWANLSLSRHFANKPGLESSERKQGGGRVKERGKERERERDIERKRKRLYQQAQTRAHTVGKDLLNLPNARSRAAKLRLIIRISRFVTSTTTHVRGRRVARPTLCASLFSLHLRSVPLPTLPRFVLFPRKRAGARINHPA